MPIFGKPGKTFVDRGRGDAEVIRLRAAAAKKDWRTVEGALVATKDQMRREFLVDSIGVDTTDLGWVDEWIREKPAEQLPRLMWGACAINYAWQVRSGLAPQHVSQDQFRGFHEWLAHAEEQLRLAASMDPADSAPWVGLLWSAVGLHPPLHEATVRWEEASRRNPRTEHGLWAYTTFIGPRWNGTAELMWEFLRGLLADEPEGSPRWSMVATSHFEQAVADGMAKGTSLRGTGHFERPDVQNDINDAYAKYLGSPAKQASSAEGLYREFFAVAFYLMGSRDATRRELSKIGPGIQNLPWAFMGSPVVIYEKAREWAGMR